jgi:hypothetical protein
MEARRRLYGRMMFIGRRLPPDRDATFELAAGRSDTVLT